MNSWKHGGIHHRVERWRLLLIYPGVCDEGSVLAGPALHLDSSITGTQHGLLFNIFSRTLSSGYCVLGKQCNLLPHIIQTHNSSPKASLGCGVSCPKRILI